jgi:heat shock protein 5
LPILGIDLGNVYSTVGVYVDGRVEMIADEQGRRLTPSLVAFTAAGQLVGHAARDQAHENPTNTIYESKRFIGRRYSDAFVQRERLLLPFKIVDTGDGKLGIEVEVKGERKIFALEEIGAMVLGQLKQNAEAALGVHVESAVLTVPAYFNGAQRQATKDAGALAGLKILQLLDAPTAAAIAYGHGVQPKMVDGSESILLVYKLGGHTLDVTLLTLDADGVFEVLATNGDTHLGGKDLDQRLLDHSISVFQEASGEDLTQNKTATAALLLEVERAKRELSTYTETRVEVHDLHRGHDLSYSLSRSKFEALCDDLFQRTLGPIEYVLQDGDIRKGDIDHIVLTGGSTRIPKIRELLASYGEVSAGIDPDMCVGYGAAVQGAVLAGKRSELERLPQVFTHAEL